jgi:cytochrome c
MRVRQLLLASLLLAGCASTTEPTPADPVAAEGQYLVKIHCASCHAIGLHDRSAHAEAPPFRILSRNYPVSALEEPLAEGIVVGHPEMPEFRFRPEDVKAIVTYLESIQTK